MERLELEKLTHKMFDFIEKESGIGREAVLTVEEDEELRQKLLDIFFDIEIEEECKCPDDDSELSDRGEIASDIVTILCYKPEDDEKDEMGKSGGNKYVKDANSFGIRSKSASESGSQRDRYSVHRASGGSDEDCCRDDEGRERPRSCSAA